MADQEVYVGSIGPFIFDDNDTYEGTVEKIKGIYTTGKMRAANVISDNAPANATDVVRLSDLSSGTGILNPTISGVTGSRALGTVYHNTSSYWMIVAITVDLEA